MSAAQDEADDGPDLSSDEDLPVENSLKHKQNELSLGNELSTPKLAKSNGVRDDDSLAVDNDHTYGFSRGAQEVESEESGSLRAFHLGPGRPSSADGSLSIPDDTPSAQVSISLTEAVALSNILRAL